jgi:hypothetical protein
MSGMTIKRALTNQFKIEMMDLEDWEVRAIRDALRVFKENPHLSFSGGTANLDPLLDAATELFKQWDG